MKLVADEIKRLYEENGKITASLVLDAARDSDSPLHDQFEWDDSAAAEQHRLDQSRKLIRRVKITYGDRTERLVHVPKVRMDEGDEGEYKPISVVVSSPSCFQRAMGEALTKLAAAQRAVKELEDAAASTEGTDEAVMVQLALALKGLAIAEDAVRSMH